MIPKVIHYCWFGGNPLPGLAVKCIESWRKYCPDYEIREWNESNFDVNICDYTREAYECKKWAFVSDYARFWILYNYGGLYFDTDVELIKPIDDIVARGSFMGMEREAKLYNKLNLKIVRRQGLEVNPGLGLGADARLDFYRELLDFYNREHFVDTNGNMNKETVVKKVSKILNKYQHEVYGNEVLMIGDIYIYNKEFFCPLDYYTGVLNVTENTRSIHHYTASWQSGDEKKNTQIFIKAKKIFGPVLGKGIGYLCTINIRRKIKKTSRRIDEKNFRVK